MGPDRLKCGSASCLIGLLLLAASGACQGPSGTATTAITTTSTGTGTGTGTADPAPAGSCPSPALSGSYPAPSAAPGYRAYIVANKLVKPRTIVPDRAGNFLVLEQGRGVVALTFGDGGGCVVEKSRKSVIENHDVCFCC